VGLAKISGSFPAGCLEIRLPLAAALVLSVELSLSYAGPALQIWQHHASLLQWPPPYLPASLFLVIISHYPCGASSARVIAMIACPCVCPSQAGIVSKRLNVGSRKQHHVIAIAQGI